MAMDANNTNKASSASQNSQILEWLANGNKLTALEALKEFGCFRLASRIHDLRDAGWDITKEMIILPNGKRVAQYALSAT